MHAPLSTDAPVFPADDLLRACVHCGFCLPVCPTYKLFGDEADSPRGRLYFMRAISENTIPLTENVRHHFDRCLVCRACETACPAGVEFGRLMERAREITNDALPPGLFARAMRRVFFGGVFPYPGRLHAVVAAIRLYQRSGLQGFVRATGLLRVVPGAWAEREAQMPTLPAHGFRAHAATVYRPTGTSVAKVALFTGCIQDEVHGHVHAATVRVLLKYGCEVHVPDGQRCCGALQAHNGAMDYARAQARTNAAAFAADHFDVVINNSAGCGASLKELAGWFGDDAPDRPAVEALSAKVRDVTEFLAELEPQEPFRPVARRVAYDDPCHLVHGQGIEAQPRALLAAIPELDLVDVPHGSDCCGAAGIYSLTQPEVSVQVRDGKIAHVTRVKPEMVATGNPGCMLQLAAGLRAAGEDIPVVHPIELLDEALGGPRAGTGSPLVEP